MKEFLQKAKESSRVVATLSTAIKNKTLLEFADALEENSYFIIEENIKDMKLARELDLSSAMHDRLYLNDSRIQDMANAIRQIASQTEPVGRVLDGWDSREHNGRAHSRQPRKQAVPRAYNKRGKRSVFFLTSGEGYREKSK